MAKKRRCHEHGVSKGYSHICHNCCTVASKTACFIISNMSVGGDLAKWKRRNDVHSFLDDINFGVGSDCCCGGFINCFYFDVQRCCKDIPTAAPRPGPRPTWYHPIEEDSIG